MQLPRAVSPMLMGVLFADGDLGLPFLIGRRLPGGLSGAVFWGFRRVDPGVGERSGI